MPEVPQPAADRIVPVAGHPLVVGVGPRRATLLAHTAAVWAHALGSEIYFAYADPSRMVEEEFPTVASAMSESTPIPTTKVGSAPSRRSSTG